jgi:hypothetical protein
MELVYRERMSRENKDQEGQKKQKEGKKIYFLA